MELKIQCDCGRPLRVINSTLKIEEQVMTVICNPCNNCINHSRQHGYEQGELQKDILNEKLRKRLSKARNVEEIGYIIGEENGEIVKNLLKENQ